MSTPTTDLKKGDVSMGPPPPRVLCCGRTPEECAHEYMRIKLREADRLKTCGVSDAHLLDQIIDLKANGFRVSSFLMQEATVERLARLLSLAAERCIRQREQIENLYECISAQSVPITSAVQLPQLN